MLDFGPLGHRRNDLLGGVDWIVLVRFDLREFVEHGLRKLALLDVENPIVAEQEPPARRIAGLIGALVLGALLRGVNLPKDNDCAFLALADVAAKLVGLPHREPKRRNVLRR